MCLSRVTRPAVIKGLPSSMPGVTGVPGATRARIVLSRASGLGAEPVVRIHNPTNDNINMNQVLSGVDVEIEPDNREAIGVAARGAQGVSVQDVTIYAGDAAVGLQGGAGSGGSHIGVTVIGGVVGIDVSSSQPAPTLTAITLLNQLKTALLYNAPGRQTLSVTGLNITTLPNASGPAISAGAPISIYDGVVYRPGSQFDATAIQASSNVFVRDVFVRGFNKVVAAPASVSMSMSGPLARDPVIPATTAAGWTRLAWYASGVGSGPDASATAKKPPWHPPKPFSSSV